MLLQFLVNLLYLLVGAAAGIFVCVGFSVVLWVVFRDDMVDGLDKVARSLREKHYDNIVVVERYLRSKFK